MRFNFFPELYRQIIFAGVIITGIASSLILNNNDVIARTYTQAKPTISESPEEIAAGKIIYENLCLSCHGIEGKGDGPAAGFMEPKPRNLATAHYILRTTPWMSLPTDADLFSIITGGVKATSMPVWERLTKKERWQVTFYIKTFSDRFKEEGAPESISFGSEISVTPAVLEKGKETFKKAKCFLCHGEEGRADGPIVVTLKNEWGISAVARDLTKGWRFKSGNTLKDIYVTITTGFNGTAMGSYAEILTDEERWNLTAYVKSLSKETGGNVVFKSKRIEEEIPMDATAPIWQEAMPIRVALAGQIMVPPREFTPTVNSAIIKSLYNNREIAFLLEWNDSTNIQDENFRDAVAIQFPVKIPESSQKPHLAMGDNRGKVNIWRWKSFWDEEISGELLNTTEPYIETTVEEMNSKGYTSLKPQPLENQNVIGRGSWSNGKWQVLMKRNIATGDSDDLQFKKGKLIPLALAIWDGSNRDVGSEKSISFWYYLVLEESTSITPYLYTFVLIIMGVSIELWFVRRLKRKSESQ
jgi:DMSO reductase family type II enzyme heme b subunit